MAGRYLVTGVQLGIIKGILQSGVEFIPTALETVEEILEKQFLGNSSNSIEFDIDNFHALLSIYHLFSCNSERKEK